MVQEIVWTSRAREDVRRIYDYIAADSARYAQVQVQTIQSVVASLAEFPSLGRSVPEFPGLPYREIIVGNYRVLYRFDERKGLVLIVAVIHGRQFLRQPPL